MSVFEDKILKKDISISRFVKTKDLLDGIWQIISIEVKVADNVRFGVQPTDPLYIRGVLKEGETLQYSFITPNGEEKIFDSKGLSFYLGFKAVNPNPKDRIKLERSGQGFNTRWKVIIVNDEESEFAKELKDQKGISTPAF